ncbi:MAG: alpha/beta hydrolase [Bacteroidota bacterium]
MNSSGSPINITHNKTISLFGFMLVFFMGVNINLLSAKENKPIVYLIPGQGADYRLFKNLKIDSNFEIKNIHYSTPEEDWNMNDFAKVLSEQIDTSRTFYLVGVSLGGMLATEMGDFLNPEKIILISSAKKSKELPPRYRFQKSFPLYKMVSGNLSKKGALFFQPIVEPDRNYDKDTFVSMLENKDPDFLKRTIAMIIEWDREKYRENTVHIHGDNDHTIPIRNVKYDYIIKDGSHMMVLTKGDELSKLINEILLD